MRKSSFFSLKHFVFQATEMLKCLQHIKVYIQSQWLPSLRARNAYETEDDLSKGDNEQHLHEWQQFALVLDRLFFLVFVIAMPCTALLFVSAHSSVSNGFRSNLTNIEERSIDAKCDLNYKPILT